MQIENQEDYLYKPNARSFSFTETQSQINYNELTNVILDDRYVLGEALLEAADSYIYKATDSVNNTEVVARIFKDNADLGYIHNEIVVLQNVNHPNLLGYKDWKMNDGNLHCEQQFVCTNTSYVITDSLRYKPLFQGRRYSEKLTKFFFLQMLDAVEALHKEGYVHTNLTPSSFVIVLDDYNESNDMCLKLTGLGSCQATDPDYERDKQAYEFRDIYNLGILLFTMTVGCKPFVSTSESDQLFKLVTTDSDQYIQYHPVLCQIHKNENISKNLLELLIKMLQSTEDSHMSIAEIRNHLWMRSTSTPYKYFVRTVLETLSK
jgi:serine/threonine protein kinase